MAGDRPHGCNAGIMKKVYNGTGNMLFVDIQTAINGISIYLQDLIPEMLQDLRDDHDGFPGYLGKNYMNRNEF